MLVENKTHAVAAATALQDPDFAGQGVFSLHRPLVIDFLTHKMPVITMKLNL